MLEQLLQEKDKITKNAQTTTEAINAYFQKIRKVINQRESALKSTVQKYCDTRLSRMDSHNQMLQNHHDAILVKVGELERLIESNDIQRLFAQKQAISEDLEAQEQSVMAVSDLIKESSNQGSLLFREGQHPSTFSEVGNLNERHKRPNSSFVTLRRLVVSEEEDPYLDVPLRFEDEQSSPPQKQVRVDESSSKMEYEPEGKPGNPDNIYNVPKPVKQQQSTQPEVPPRRTSREKTPPLPPRRPQSRRNSSQRPASPHSPDWTRSYQNFDPKSLKRSDQSHYMNFTPDLAQRARTLPPSLSSRSQSTPSVKPPPILSEGSSEDSGEVGVEYNVGYDVLHAISVIYMYRL